MSTEWSRIIVHADMDAFYAAVEQLDDPSLRGKPLLIGGRSGRGVVLTASYEARPFGVGSAMPMLTARRLCPQARVVPPRFARYMEISQRILRVFEDFSPIVEALSLDEAFMDMSGAEGIFGAPRKMGNAIKSAVFEATGGLTISVGISGTKYVAKVASDHNKPDGLVIVPQADARAFLAPLPVTRLWGAGPKTVTRLKSMGYHSIGDIASADFKVLQRQLGSLGPHFYHLAHAEDSRPVLGRLQGKSVGSERTLETDISDRTTIERYLRRSADDVGQRLRRHGLQAKGVRVKLKTRRFQLMSRQARLPAPTAVGRDLLAAGIDLLDCFEHREPYRLVGLAAFDLLPDRPTQLDLFDGSYRRLKLEAALDTIRDRYGGAAVIRAEELELAQHGPRMGVNLDCVSNQPEERHLETDPRYELDEDES